MGTLECARNIMLYRLYCAFNEPLFWGPVVIASMNKLAHMPLPEIYTMESITLCICILFDIPSGALADLIGRKKALVIGRTFLFMSYFFFAAMTCAAHAWIANILWAIGYTMQSGADSAFLYSTLKCSEDEAEFKHTEGRAIGARFLLVAFCSLATGFLASINLRLPLFAGLPFLLIPLWASAKMTEPAITGRYSVKRQLAVLERGKRFFTTSPEVRWIIAFGALLGTTAKLWFFTYNPYFELVNLPLTHYGIVFFLLNTIAFMSSHYAARIEKYLGEKSCIILMVACTSVPILLMSFIPIMPFAYLVLIQNVVRGFMRPFVCGDCKLKCVWYNDKNYQLTSTKHENNQFETNKITQ